MRVPLFPHPHQHLSFLVFLILAILTGGRRYLIVVLIGISLMLGDVEHLFLCLIAICVSLEKIPVWVLWPFLIGSFFVIELYEFFLYFGY